LIFNVAMGGTFGGAIDPAFSQSSMDWLCKSISIRRSIYLKKLKRSGVLPAFNFNNEN
jgi:hypothetical protein